MEVITPTHCPVFKAFISQHFNISLISTQINQTDPETSRNATIKLSMLTQSPLRPTRSGFIHSFYFFTLLYYCRAIFNLSFYSKVQRPSFPFFTIELTLLLKQHCYFFSNIPPMYSIEWSHVEIRDWANIYGSSVGRLENKKMSTKPFCYLYGKNKNSMTQWLHYIVDL